MQALRLMWRMAVHEVNLLAGPSMRSLHAIGVAQGIRLVVKPCWYGAGGQSWQQFLTERLLQQ